MADTFVIGTTNKIPNSCVDLICTCPVMWSRATQFAYLRMCNHKPKTQEYHLIDSYVVRARRISATYARLYLEQEKFSQPEKKGRFYWAALAAFASKTVACSLELSRVKMIPVIHQGLAKGNFWLFMDIAATHAYWAMESPSFKQCASARAKVDELVPTVTAQMKKLPWHDEAMATLRNLPITPEIDQAFDKMMEYQSADQDMKPIKQLEHLMLVANHEQRKILQPLIYDDPYFSCWLEFQRQPYVQWATPKLELVFTRACSTDDPTLKSTAPKNTVLENEDSRMDWIKLAVQKFHGLMQKRAPFMEKELCIMAGWVSLPDTIIHLNEMPPS
ncbi:DUF2515 family protein [Glaciimonas sp. GNP009]